MFFNSFIFLTLALYQAQSYISKSYKYSGRQILCDPVIQVERLRLSGIREHVQDHTAVKTLKRDVDTLRWP